MEEVGMEDVGVEEVDYGIYSITWSDLGLHALRGLRVAWGLRDLEARGGGGRVWLLGNLVSGRRGFGGGGLC